MKHVLILVTLISISSQAQKLWGDLRGGPNRVGFRTIRAVDSARSQRPIMICVWYPTNDQKRSMPFKEYLYAGVINDHFLPPDDNEKQYAIDQFKHVLSLPFISGGQEINADKLKAAMEFRVAAVRDAVPLPGKFPVVFMSTEPESLSVTAEYLASHGFVAIAVHTPNDPNRPADDLIYHSVTLDLLWMMNHLQLVPEADARNLGAVGFGGGIQASFYLTMKSDKIKALVNIDGGVFGPRSLTTHSVDYAPERMNTSMLHIVSQSQLEQDDTSQISALKQASIYRLAARKSEVKHQDFSIYGRMMAHGLALSPGRSKVVEPAYVEAHKVTLTFLKLFLIDDQRIFPKLKTGNFNLDQIR